jgi:hypothetical protein
VFDHLQCAIVAKLLIELGTVGDVGEQDRQPK